MPEMEPGGRINLFFYATATGNEPVREWLRSLEAEARHAIGLDLMRVQWRWPIGMPLCRPMGGGLWEVRTALPDGRIARVLFCKYRDDLVILHGFIKKTRATPVVEIGLAMRRRRDLDR